VDAAAAVNAVGPPNTPPIAQDDAYEVALNGDLNVKVRRGPSFSWTAAGLTDPGSLLADVWFTDDQTVSTTPGHCYAGKILAVESSTECFVDHTPTWVEPFKSQKIQTELLDVNGNELFSFTATTDAVNEVTLANAAADGNPKLSATGDDTNIDLELAGKGTGGVLIGDDEKLVFGADGDVTMEYDEDGTDELRIAGSVIFEDEIHADAGIQVDDDQAITFGDDGDATIAYDETTDDKLEITCSNGITLAGSTVVSGTLDAGTSCEADAFTVGGVAGADFGPAAPATITVVKGIVTAAGS